MKDKKFKKNKKLVDEACKEYDNVIIACANYDKNTGDVKGFCHLNGNKKILAKILVDIIDDEDIKPYIKKEIEGRMEECIKTTEEITEIIDEIIDVIKGKLQ